MMADAQLGHGGSYMKGSAAIGKRACTVIVLCALATLGSPAQTFTTLVSFNGSNGANPVAGLVQGTNGDGYGTTSSGGAGTHCTTDGGCGTVFKITPSGILTTLYSFCSEVNCTDGSNPDVGLVQATNGDLYGTTVEGGANANCPISIGCGTVFKITPGGIFTTLHSF